MKDDVKNGANIRLVCRELRKLGYPPHITAALMGNIMQECLGAWDIKPHASGDDGNSIGIGQWHAERRVAIEQFAASRGKSADDLLTQVRFLHEELQSTEKRAFAAIMACSTVERATAAACDHYWRPGKPRKLRRIFYARYIHDRMPSDGSSRIARGIRRCRDRIVLRASGILIRRKVRRRRIGPQP